MKRSSKRLALLVGLLAAAALAGHGTLPAGAAVWSPAPVVAWVAHQQDADQDAAQQATVDAPTAPSPSSPSAPGTGLSNNNYYTNVDGVQVHSPAYSTGGSVPAGASARCRDRTYSYSRHRQGTCSGHGGVAQWY